MSRFTHILLLIALALVSVVQANTQNVHFFFRGSDSQSSNNAPSSSQDLPRIEPLLSNDTEILSTKPDRVMDSIQPGFERSKTRSFRVFGEIGTKYEVRVCSSAASPVLHELSFQDYFNGTGLVTISTVPNFYSQYPQLMKTPREGSQEIIINRLVFNVMPTDNVAPFGLITLAVIGALAASRPVLSYIFA